MKLDAQSQAVLDGLNASGVLPFRRFSAAEARQQILSLRPERPSVTSDQTCRVSEETITTPDGSFAVRILRPSEKRTARPMGAVIYFHGGGFFAGGLEETDLIVRQIAHQAGVVVFNVDYHLSPEARFPVAVNDAYAALCWVEKHADRHGVDRQRIIIAGDSAGGNLTIVTCLQARENGGPEIRLQVPIYPSLDLRMAANYASRAQWGGGDYFLINDDIEWMLEHYFKRRDEGDDWRASPIVARSYVGLPPALVITASHDPLVDEGKLYADRLAEAGVSCEYSCFEGTIHGFVSFAGVIDSGARAIDLICNRIKDTAAQSAVSASTP